MGSNGSALRASRSVPETAYLAEGTTQECRRMRQTLIRTEQTTSTTQETADPQESSASLVSNEKRIRFYRPYDDPDEEYVEIVVPAKGKKKYVEEVGDYCNFCHGKLPLYPIYKFRNPYDAVTLPCGHVYHFKCWEMTIPKEQSTDPPCIVCVSCSSRPSRESCSSS